jgi:hypothetical protein
LTLINFCQLLCASFWCINWISMPLDALKVIA